MFSLGRIGKFSRENKFLGLIDMIFLEIFILLIGLIISFLSLIKQEPTKKINTKKILAISYIMLFILSVILLGVKTDDSEKSGLILFKAISTLEEDIIAQTDTLNSRLDSLSLLNKKMDDLVGKTEEAIIQREQNQKVFDEQNRLLEKSNELTQKQIEDAKPEVTVYTEHITFSYVDSLQTQKRIVFTNEGERIAQKFRSKDIIVFKSKIDDKYFYYHLSYSDDSEIYPSKMLVSTDIIPVNYQEIFEKTNGGIVIISIRCIDELLLNNIEKQLVFRVQIDHDKIKVFKESSVPLALEEYLFKNNINLRID